MKFPQRPDPSGTHVTGSHRLLGVDCSLGNERGSPARGVCALKQRAISTSPRKSDGVIQLVTNSLILLPCDSFISFSYLMDYFAVYRSHLGFLKAIIILSSALRSFG